MPAYQVNKTYRGGFYNNKNVDGKDDRVYTAEDIRKPYDTVFSDGIMPGADGTAGETLKVTSTGGMGISVSAGNAKLGGAWFENSGNFSIVLDASGTSDRYDCVIIRNDDTDEVREPSIYVKSLSAPPTGNDLTRTNYIYELCVAYVRVPATATAITDENIIDTREDGTLCNTMRGVGATVIRTYRNTYFSETKNQTVIPIGIPHFDKSRDTLSVIVEGRLFSDSGSGKKYTVTDNEKITLINGLPVVGTRIDFEVAKNVNAAGAETVVQEVGELIKEMSAVNKTLEHHYYCNGTNDNIQISQIAQAFINGGTDYRGMRLVVHGNVGATEPYSGAGTTSRNYFWFALGSDGESTNRRLTVDFTDCTAINLPIESGTYNTAFSGNDIHIIGASVIASQNGAGTYIRMFSSSSGVVMAENSRFWITADIVSYISQTGTFKNCRGSVTCSSANAYCFQPTSGSLLRVEGGEFYAYSASGYTSAVVYQTAADAVAVLYGVNCPTSARSGLVQSYAVFASGAHISITDTFPTLSLSVPNGNVRGTLAISKPGLM